MGVAGLEGRAARYGLAVGGVVGLLGVLLFSAAMAGTR